MQTRSWFLKICKIRQLSIFSSLDRYSNSYPVMGDDEINTIAYDLMAITC